MKFIKNLLGVAFVAALALTASAQNGFDYIYTPRTLLITPPTVMTGATTYSNQPADVHLFVGTAKIDVAVSTNGAAGTHTFTLYGSPDLTNWTTVGSCMINSNILTTIAYTNSAGYPTKIWATNTYLMPGIVVTPTSATAGFATPYLQSYPMTNNAVIACNQGGVFEIGFNVDDAGRYISLSHTTTGANTTNTVVSFFTGRLITQGN